MHKNKAFVGIIVFALSIAPSFFLENIPAKPEPILPETKKSISIVNENKNYGSAKTDIDAGYVDETVTLTLTLKNPMLYAVKSLTINDEKIAINSTNVYCFSITDSDVLIDVSFMEAVSSTKISSLSFQETNPLEGDYSLSINDTDYVADTVSYNTGDIAKIKATPKDGYLLSSIYNSEYKVLPDSNKDYSFLLNSTNEIKVTFKSSGNTLFTDFKANYPNAFSTYDFVDEINNNKTTLGLLFNALIQNTANQDKVIQQCYSTASTTALFVTNEQITRTSWMKSSANILKENITYSNNVKMAERIYFSNNSIDYYRVRNQAISSDKDVDYSSSTVQEMSFDFYYKNYQSDIHYPTPYSLNPEYVLSSSSISKTSQGYEANLDLDIKCMDIFKNYMITTTSDADFSLARQSSAPTFISVSLKLTFTDALCVLTTQDAEVYDVNSVAGAARTKASSDATYSYPENIDLPDIKTAISY
ncbi:MAG: hypothetical protein WCR56_04150 [Bacilli bacterium]